MLALITNIQKGTPLISRGVFSSMRKQCAKRCQREGFTLVEVMVASTILLMAVAATLGVFLSVHRSSYSLSDAVELNANTRVLQDRVLFDVRSINGISSIDEQSIAGTYIDFNSGASHAVTYKLEEGQLKRAVTAADGTVNNTVVMGDLITDTTKPSYSRFEFRDRTDNTVAYTDPNKVRSIRFYLVPAATARQAGGLVAGKNDSFCTALVQLRNFLPVN